jgi:hypothetical protein
MMVAVDDPTLVKAQTTATIDASIETAQRAT